MSSPLRIGIIIGSTRPTRVGDQVAAWVKEQGERLSDSQFEVIDLAEVNLPLLDEPYSASMGNYQNDHTKAFAARIAPLDAFIFVTPEYNHAPSSALINALSYIYAEWNDKSAALVSYGFTANGARAAAILRSMFGELQLADVRQQLALSIPAEFENYSTFAPGEHNVAALGTLLEQLESWGRALQGVRAEKARAAAAA